MYTPDRTFVRKLKEQDRNLGCHFNGRHFVITYQRAYGDPVAIWVVMGDNQGFRQPDQRDLDEVMKSDINNESPIEKHQRVASYMAQFRERQKIVTRENMHNRGKDGKRQIKQAYDKIVGPVESCRVTPKPKQAATFEEMTSSR